MQEPSNAAEALLALLDHTDPATLTVLLERPSLVRLLRHAGRSETDTAAALASRMPGVVLLELFREGRTAEELVAALGPDATARIDQEGAMKGARPKTAAKALRYRPVQAVHRVGLFLVCGAGLALPLLSMLDVRFALLLLRLNIALIFAAIFVAGAVGGVLFAKGRVAWWTGALAGALCAVGGGLTTSWYVTLGPGAGRESILRIEIAVAFLVGTLPGVVVYGAFGKTRATS